MRFPDPARRPLLATVIALAVIRFSVVYLDRPVALAMLGVPPWLHLARLPPQSLESLILAVIERPEFASQVLEVSGRSKEESDIESDAESNL